jgi:hypothetical protein
MVTRPEAKRLSFSLDEVIRFAVLTLAIAGAFWATTSGLRADISSQNTNILAIKNAIETQGKLAASDMKLQDERLTNLRTTVEAMTRRQELQQYEIQQLKEMMLKAGIIK